MFWRCLTKLLKMNPPVAGVLFDMDGTLVDSLDSFMFAAKEALRVFGIAGIQDQVLREQIKKPFDRILPLMAPQLSDDDAKRLVEVYLEVYNHEGYKLAKPTPHALDLLQWLKANGVSTAIVTSRSLLHRIIPRMLERCGISRYIDVVVTTLDVPKPKPAPFQHQLALKRLNVDGCRALAVGDSPEDIIGAHAAGVSAVAYTRGFHPMDELAKYNPDFIIHDLLEIVRFLEPSSTSG